MQATINLQGIKVHVGFYRAAGQYQIDPADTYVTNDASELVAEIDNIDLLGMIHPEFGWVSLRFLAEDYADDHHAEWDRLAAIQAHTDAVEAREAA